jgi:alpha/beta superfamily hydrolase
MIYAKKKDLIVLFLFIIQRHLLYFPNTSTSYNQQYWQTLYVNKQTLALESKDNFQRVILLFHGNAGNANDREFYKNVFPKNTHLIVVEYPGYGINHLQDINKDNLLNHARKVTAYVKSQYGENIIIAGESLGTALASQMANEFKINKLLLITPYTSIKQVAQSKFWFVPISLLLKDNYDNVEFLQNYQGQALLVIAEKDNVISSKYGHKLYESINIKQQLNIKKDLIVVKNANHNNWHTYINKTNLEKIHHYINN